MQKRTFFSILLLALTIVVLPSCKWFKDAKENISCPSCPSEKVEGKNDGSAVLISFGKEPALTAKEFEEFINKTTEGNDQIKLWMQFVPDFKEQIFNVKKRSLIINKWANKEGVRNSKEYKDKEKMIMDSIRDSLDYEEFIKRHDIEVSDEDAKKYYEENKGHDPRIMTAPEGIKSAGISFRNQAEANEFAENVKRNVRAFDKLAKDKKLSVTQFGMVNEDSTIDSKIKEKIIAIKSFPCVVVVKDSKGKFWVVVAYNKEKAQFRSFDQVKDLVKKLIKPKKVEEMLENELTKLEKDYNVVIDKAYFEEQKKKAEAEAQEAAKGLNQPEANAGKKTEEDSVKELAMPKGV